MTPTITRPAGHPLVGLELVDGDVAVLTLDDADHRNALSIELSLDLGAAVEGALASGVGAIVLCAAGPVFCAGGALDDLITPRATLEETYTGFVALADCPVVTVAAVGGAAIGAGVNLPLACDVVVTSPAARFDPRLLDLGIHPGGGQLWRLVDRVGRQGAAALSLCGDVLDGAEAEAKGLAWRCVADDDLVPTALRLARRAAGRPRAAVLRAKQTLDASLAIGSAEEAMALELEAQRRSMADPDLPGRVTALQDSLARRTRQP
ncbi:enoyl-CoA hydratase-related protein [Rhabdothermincola salaria]|uniref:enoyl-CoA hydratase-related protein n=1 Tax=Rhabdothermincola salaria TaxID=2903142 RepID=UPI001E571AC5|nr:enoyl-CoA hydratase-related protein [Rhabdothermincola salaria]MCD9624105.1 enoyl-CoA hydratase-related protein [Rhabdothermincola salaria]